MLALLWRLGRGQQHLVAVVTWSSEEVCMYGGAGRLPSGLCSHGGTRACHPAGDSVQVPSVQAQSERFKDTILRSLAVVRLPAALVYIVCGPAVAGLPSGAARIRCREAADALEKYMDMSIAAKRKIRGRSLASGMAVRAGCAGSPGIPLEPPRAGALLFRATSSVK